MSEKILFVIPAYNEEKNISKPIKDIRENFKDADIIVVNDCSKDNTVSVLRELGVEYLDLPVNLGYSGAVQTGIKYAKRNNYDYVIQFDGDGQHLAMEAHKLFDVMKASSANIVIGSRFIEKTEYKHPFFRKIGTKFFSILIKLITRVKITDPTSGFQVLDKKTIATYSQPGQYPEFPDANLIAKMIINGYRVEEVSCKMKERIDGVSMHAGMMKPLKYAVRNTYSLVIIGLTSVLRGKRNNDV